MPKNEKNIALDPSVVASERLKQEEGAVIKDHDGKLSIALVYPNRYEVGMSNLGFQKVYHLLNSRPNTVCERAFMPSPEEVAFIKANRLRLASMETNTPLLEFDVVAFSITFEEDYLNVLSILDLAGIGLTGRYPGDPLIAIGGICPTLNPEVLAEFVDIAFIGEAETIIDPFCDTLIEKGPDLLALSKIPGVYVPSAYEPIYNEDHTLWRFSVKEDFPLNVTRAWNRDFANDPNATVIETENTIFGDMSLVEVNKGCGKHCRFCAVGYAYRPTRHGDIVALFDKIDQALMKKGKVGLLGSAIGDHPDIEWILDHIVDRGGEFSISSIRLDQLNDRLLESLMAGKCKTITVAPEAGTESLRRRINKDLSDDQIKHAIRCIAATWQFNIKLYFLVGLPGETIDDVNGIVYLVKQMQHWMVESSRRRGTVGSLKVSVDGFVPKPFTPFQWEPYAGVKEVRKRLKIVREGLRATPNVNVQTGSSRANFVQTILSVGDRRVGPIINRAKALDGNWFAAFAESTEAGLDPAFFALRRKNVKEILPWDIVDHQLKPRYLSDELARSNRDKVSPECPPPSDKCERCGSFDSYCLHTS